MSEVAQNLENLSAPTAKAKYIAYPAYRDSGIEWLGDVPDGWNLIRLRYQAKINPTKSEIATLPSDTEVSFVPMESVYQYGGMSTDSIKLLEEVDQGYTYFREGDVVIAKITPCFENGKGSLALNLQNEIGFGTTELHVMRAIENLDVRYLFYLSISDPFRKIGASEMYGAGGQKRVPESFIKDLKLFIPDKTEQHSIANFLDSKIAQIDALIENKQRLIELLKEKRTALISQAVTKGLDPNVKMKDSGVEWLGEVPEGWKIKKLKHCTAKIGSGKTPKGGAEVYTSSGVALLRSQNVYDDGLRLNDVVFIDEDTDLEMENTRVELFDVLLNITGASIGRCSLASDNCLPANVNQHVCIIRTNLAEFLPEFAHIFLCSKNFKDFISSEEQGTSREGLNFQQIGKIPVPLPSTDIQSKLIKAVTVQTTKIDALIKKVQTAIDKLKEYRTAIISAAVTGKIDVKGK